MVIISCLSKREKDLGENLCSIQAIGVSTTWKAADSNSYPTSCVVLLIGNISFEYNA